jgi:hypothetical protein
LFVFVEVTASQLVEPQLYGHTTGLSPFSVVIASIIWSWIWGPIGLFVSTPLTLCLLVAGRHIKTLSLLDILLSDSHALTMPERFYQRALSGDSDEIIASARLFLKRNSFATYCDLVLMPAVHLARLDLAAGTISNDQQFKIRSAVVTVITALDGKTRRFARRHGRVSVLDDRSLGLELRRQREQQSGRWQGPLDVPLGSVILCVGLGSAADDLAAELMVRILREQRIDARHVSIQDFASVPPPGASSQSISLVYLVSAYPSEERERGAEVAADLRRRFAHAGLISVFLPGMILPPEPSARLLGVDEAVTSFAQAVLACSEWHQPKAVP